MKITVFADINFIHWIELGDLRLKNKAMVKSSQLIVNCNYFDIIGIFRVVYLSFPRLVSEIEKNNILDKTESQIIVNSLSTNTLCITAVYNHSA